MILMACVDGRNGMAFNCRRQSRDRAVRADLYWDLSLEGWTLARREEFPGFSHEIITKEVYIP